jgi:hypothetical protein
MQDQSSSSQGCFAIWSLDSWDSWVPALRCTPMDIDADTCSFERSVTGLSSGWICLKLSATPVMITPTCRTCVTRLPGSVKRHSTPYQMPGLDQTTTGHRHTANAYCSYQSDHLHVPRYVLSGFGQSHHVRHTAVRPLTLSLALSSRRDVQSGPTEELGRLIRKANHPPLMLQQQGFAPSIHWTEL